MKTIYILTKNSILITRVFHNEINAKLDCKRKNAVSPDNINYRYVVVHIADSQPELR